MQQNQDFQTFSPEGMRSFANWFALVARSLATTVEVFLHDFGSFGHRYLSIQVLIGIVILFVFPIFWQGQDALPVWYFLGGFILVLIVHRVRIAHRMRRGPNVHSLYTGRPTVMRLPVLRSMSEEKVKGLVEPLIVFLSGVFLLPVCEPLGSYLMLAALGLFLSVGFSAGEERRRAMELNDAYIDQAQAMQRFRDMRGDR